MWFSNLGAEYTLDGSPVHRWTQTHTHRWARVYGGRGLRPTDRCWFTDTLDLNGPLSLLWSNYTGRVYVLSAGWGNRGRLMALTGTVIHSDSSRSTSDRHSTLCVTGTWLTNIDPMDEAGAESPKRPRRHAMWFVCLTFVGAECSTNACGNEGCTWGVPAGWTAGEAN